MQKRTIKLSSKYRSSKKYKIKTITKPVKTASKKSGKKKKGNSREIMPKQKLIMTGTGLDDGKTLASVEDMLKVTQITYSAAKAARGTMRSIQTGTVSGMNGVRRIATAVRHNSIPKNLSSGVKAGGKLLGKGVTKATANAAVGVKESVLRTSIDKSKVTDTGIESVKQGVTYVRYATNAKRTASNSIKTAKKTAKNIRNAPKNIRKTTTNIKRSANVVKNASKASAKLMAKLATSKVFWILLLVVVLILINQILISSLITSLSGMFGGTFGWLDDDENDEKKSMEKYIKKICNYEEDCQKDIDKVYFDFEPDTQEFEPYSPMWEFRDSRFKYEKLDDKINEREVVAITAARWYSERANEENPPDDLKLKKKDLENTTDHFFEFNYGYEYDYCLHYDCCQFGEIMTSGDVTDTIYYGNAWYCDSVYYHGCKRIFLWINKDVNGNWDFEHHINGDRNFCDNPNHCYLSGGVKIKSADEAMNEMGFTAEERDWYKTYIEVINDILK